MFSYHQDFVPILYTFRRCPYAMRARLALAKSHIKVEIREILLREKPQQLLNISPKGTVPVLQVSPHEVLEESRDIMEWAYHHSRQPWSQDLTLEPLIDENDTNFKQALDRYKYPTRYPNERINRHEQREKGRAFLEKLEKLLQHTSFLEGSSAGYTDIAIFPFVRQFSRVDLEWFQSLPLCNVQEWLDDNLESDLFKMVMTKFPQWSQAQEHPLYWGR